MKISHRGTETRRTAKQPFNAKNAKDWDAESAKNSPAAEISREVREVRKGTAKKTKGRGRWGRGEWLPLFMGSIFAFCHLPK